MTALYKKTPHRVIVFFLLPVLLLILPLYVFAADSWLASTLWFFVFNLFGSLMGWAGDALDFAVTDFVVGFGARFNVYLEGTVNALWASVRDLFNLLLIFGLVYIGLKMIMNSSDSSARKWLVMLILSALLVNFSLFITKFMVDVTNILSTEIAAGFLDPTEEEYTVSVTFMDIIGLQSVTSLPGPVTEDENEPWGYIFGAALMFIVGTFVFFAGAILLMIRYAVLIIYMIFSPLMFIGWVFPGFASASTKYWRAFLGRAFFAPVYLLMLLFSAQVLQTFFGSFPGSGTSEISGVLGGDPANFENTIPPFIIASVFLIAAVVAGQKLGAEGAGQAISLGRNIAGRARRRVQNTAVSTARTAKNVATQPLSRGARRTSYAFGKGLEKGMRNLRAQDNAAGKIARTRWVDSAAGATAQKAQGAKFGLSETRGQQKTRIQKQENEIQRQYQQDKKLAEKRAAAVTFGELGDDGAKTAASAIGNILRKMPDKDKLGLSEQQLTDPAVAKNFTDADIKLFRESGQYSNDKIKEMEKARDTGTWAQMDNTVNNTEASLDDLTSAFEDNAKTWRGLSDERKAGMKIDYEGARDAEGNYTGANLLNENIAMNLTEKDFETLEKSGTSAADIAAVREKQEAGLKKFADGTFADRYQLSDEDRKELIDKQRRALMDRTDALPAVVFKERQMAPYLTTRAADKSLREGTIRTSDVPDINRVIVGGMEAGGDKYRRRWEKWEKDSSFASDFTIKGAQSEEPESLIDITSSVNDVRNEQRNS